MPQVQNNDRQNKIARRRPELPLHLNKLRTKPKVKTEALTNRQRQLRVDKIKRMIKFYPIFPMSSQAVVPSSKQEPSKPKTYMGHSSPEKCYEAKKQYHLPGGKFFPINVIGSTMSFFAAPSYHYQVVRKNEAAIALCEHQINNFLP
jgi:hypothetical protein